MKPQDPSSLQDIAPQVFGFVALEPSGERIAGHLKAHDEQEAKNELRRQGLFLVELQVASSCQREKKYSSRAIRPLSQAEQAQFVHALARLVVGQFPIDRALRVLSESLPAKQGTIATRLGHALRKGEVLSNALPRCTGITDPAVRALICAGETSGAIGSSLEQADQILSARIALRRKLVTALLYPAVLILLSFCSLLLILVFIIPEFEPIVADRLDLVSPLGRMVFALSSWLTQFWPGFVLLLSSLVLACALLQRSGRLQGALLWAALRTPVLNELMHANRIALLARTMGALLERSIPLCQVLRILETAQLHPRTSSALAKVARAVDEGSNLSVAMEAQNLMPENVLSLIRIGEESRTLHRSLTLVAEELEEQNETTLRRLLTLLSPCLIASVGAIVGVSIYAVFSAVVSINSISL